MERHGMYKEIVSVKILLVLLSSMILMFGCKWSAAPTDEEKESFSIKFSPSAVEIFGTDETTEVDVVVEKTSGLIAARFTISFDPSVVEVTKIVTSGITFLFTDAGAEVSKLESYYDNENGRIVVGIGALKQGFTGAFGTGVLATITFKGKNPQSGYLNFIDIQPTDIVMSVYSPQSDVPWIELPVLTYNGIINVNEKESVE